MAIIKMNILAINERFPDHKKTIKRLYREDETFQSICEDYQSCYEALKRWSQSVLAEASARKIEYADLLRDLEQEILQYLREHSPA